MNSPDISSLLSGVLKDPEMLSKIMGVAANLSSSGIFSELKNESIPTESEPRSENTVSQANASGASVFSDPKRNESSFKDSAEKRRALLYALKPFLGEKRRDKIDFILKVLALLDAADSFNKPKK